MRNSGPGGRAEGRGQDSDGKGRHSTGKGGRRQQCDYKNSGNKKGTRRRQEVPEGSRQTSYPDRGTGLQAALQPGRQLTVGYVVHEQRAWLRAHLGQCPAHIGQVLRAEAAQVVLGHRHEPGGRGGGGAGKGERQAQHHEPSWAIQCSPSSARSGWPHPCYSGSMPTLQVPCSR